MYPFRTNFYAYVGAEIVFLKKSQPREGRHKHKRKHKHKAQCKHKRVNFAI